MFLNLNDQFKSKHTKLLIHQEKMENMVIIMPALILVKNIGRCTKLRLSNRSRVRSS